MKDNRKMNRRSILAFLGLAPAIVATFHKAEENDMGIKGVLMADGPLTSAQVEAIKLAWARGYNDIRDLDKITINA